jgi:hypothetical protein
MKLFSYITLSALLTISACSHHSKSCCADKSKEEMTCTKEKCDKPCCDKDKKCSDGSCTKDAKKMCEGDSCKKKS